MIEFERPDGQKAPGYYSAPAAGNNAPGVVMIEEWWGVTDWIKQTADQLAAEGFRVLIPDLFRGRTAAVGDEANHLLEGLNFGDATSQDAHGAAEYLTSTGSANVAVMGYCIGGALSMLCAMDDSAFASAVTFYGLPPAEAGDPGMITIPIQGHWATRDGFFTIDKVDAFEGRLKAGGVVHEFYRYEADHGFCNTGEVGNAGLGHYDAISAKLAWARTTTFLKKTLS